MSLQHEHTLSPISALDFHQPEPGTLLVLAGEGPYLKIFDAKKSTLLCQCKVFDGQTIHGITVRDAVDHEDGLQAAIWGGSSLTLLRKTLLQKLLDQSVTSITDTTTLASDWILDAAISPFDDSCVLVTAHNTVLRARILEQEILLETLTSPSRSILYSAHIIWESKSGVLVAAGTVFGEIIVWQCSVSGIETSQTLFIFTGHEGSIFGVSLSPPVTYPDGSVSRLLASCSDDRTIRVWDLRKSTEEVHMNGSIGPRETGFGESESKEDVKSSLRSLATVMGHASRIWRVKFLVRTLENHSPSSIDIISFGEDSTAQQWELNLGSAATSADGSSHWISGTKATLTHKQTFSFHSGKHIWSAACYQLDLSKAVIATGGADGKISLYSIETSEERQGLPGLGSAVKKDAGYKEEASSEPAYWSSSFELDDVLKSLPPPQNHQEHEDDSKIHQPEIGKISKPKKPKKFKKDAFNRYTFVSEHKFLVTTNFGRILLGNINEAIVWEELFLPALSDAEDLKSYAVLRGFSEFEMAFLAGSSGKIYGYELGCPCIEIGNIKGKVADMLAVLDPGKRASSLLATTLATQTATLFVVGETLTSTLQRSPVSYTLPDKFIVTSAGIFNSFLVLGSRNGSLAVYDAQVPQAPLTVWRELASAGDAITTILPLPNQDPSSSPSTNYFLTTSRDGKYAIFACATKQVIDSHPVGVTLHLIHHGTPPFGPMIENAWFQPNNDLILYGFRSTNFIVWNETKQTEVTSVECGGAHRSYAYSPSKSSTGNGNGHFVYTKASKLYAHTQFKPSHRIIKQGGHGREIKACTVSPDGCFIATGAEDTAIRIWGYNSNSTPNSPLPEKENGFESKAVIMKHTTGIQHLQFLNSNYLLSSGGNEEFFIWAIQRIPGFGIGIVCEATCPDQSADQDLRVMSFDVSDLPFPGKEGLLISLAFSDSTIRSYGYEKRAGFTLLGQGRYTAACLMQIRHLSVSGEEVKILIAGTDGRLVLWSLDLAMGKTTQKLTFLSRKAVHQSTIKSLDIKFAKKYIAIVTGGDDNALAISVFPRLKPLDKDWEPSVFRLKSAHAAAITGLCILNDNIAGGGREGQVRIVSSGNDQRVKEWEVLVFVRENEKGFEVQIRRTGDEFTTVADVGEVVGLSSRGNAGGERVLVVGNGMDVWGVS